MKRFPPIIDVIVHTEPVRGAVDHGVVMRGVTFATSDDASEGSGFRILLSRLRRGNFVRAFRARNPSWVVHRKIEFHDGMDDITTAVVTEVVDLGQLPAYVTMWGEEFAPNAVVLRTSDGETIDGGE